MVKRLLVVLVLLLAVIPQKIAADTLSWSLTSVPDFSFTGKYGFDNNGALNIAFEDGQVSGDFGATTTLSVLSGTQYISAQLVDNSGASLPSELQDLNIQLTGDNGVAGNIGTVASDVVAITDAVTLVPLLNDLGVGVGNTYTGVVTKATLMLGSKPLTDPAIAQSLTDSGAYDADTKTHTRTLSILYTLNDQPSTGQ